LASFIRVFDYVAMSASYEFTPFEIINFKFVRIPNIVPEVLAQEVD